MRILGIIPARFQSTRFPGKPLALIHGKSMISRVYAQALLANKLNDVVVATDDQRIMDHVLGFGGKAVMTDASHPSGTDRCAEVLRSMKGNFDVAINIQGDEPYIHPEQINRVAELFDNADNQIATLAKVITDADEVLNPNIPKVLISKNGKALYFSRSPIPYSKSSELSVNIESGLYFKHIGIYGYRSDVLETISHLPKGKLETAESLEQLRWLENDYSISISISEHRNIAVDTPEDIGLIESIFSAD